MSRVTILDVIKGPRTIGVYSSCSRRRRNDSPTKALGVLSESGSEELLASLRYKPPSPSEWVSTSALQRVLHSGVFTTVFDTDSQR